MHLPSEIIKMYSLMGSTKVYQPVFKSFILAIFAGAFIALGALGSQIISCGVVPVAFGRALSGIIFPIGLAMVVIAGGELFTGNCLLFIPVLDKQISLMDFVKNLAIVYVGNLVGSIFIAVLANYGHILSLYSNDLARSVVATATLKANIPFIDAFVKGILCNILVCIAVWASQAAEELSGRIIALFLPIFLFIVCGFEHSVANMYFIPCGMLAQYVYGFTGYNITIFGFLWNLLPVTLGNLVGGSLLVGGGYYLAYLRSMRGYEDD
ncbi:MAG: formate/nitrite transporter family protein [Treponema sp.]|nr:formate/nitrite transporter family protein [Treponema sp.]MBQ8680140.1 formate/nitrite transporter family protein [Treponema sp.]